MTTAAFAVGVMGAQARPDCRSATAEDLLGAETSTGADGFALTQRLCDAKLVRRAVTVAPAVQAPAEASAPALLPPREAKPTPAAPAARTLSVTTARDAAGQARVRSLAPLMAEVAQRHDIDPLLLHAVAHIESRHQSQAVSHAGARGVMQVMPATGRGLGVADARDLLTPQANLEASAKYLKRLQARFGNDLTLVLAAYNAGEGAVERHGRRVPPFAETQAYVRNVLAVYAELRRWFGGGRA